MKPSRNVHGDHYQVAIVGGGTAGLAAAAQLRRLGVGRVVVVEREVAAGGIPRHCGHYPFGLREYGRLMKGPAYAYRNVETAQRLGVEILTGTNVTQLLKGGRLALTSHKGATVISARRVILCTGVREASRAQRLISGARPRGVISTGALQSYVYLKGVRPFSRPIIFGSELVSFSAIATCRHLGIRPAAMLEEEPQIRARSFVLPYLAMARMPLFTGIHSPRIMGENHVEAVTFTDKTGINQTIEADGVIVSGRFRPEGALVRDSHLEIDPKTGGPVVDQFGQCSDPMYFSAGNVLRPAETSGWCWREGVSVARMVAADMQSENEGKHTYVRLICNDPALAFAVPQKIRLSEETSGMKHLQIGLQAAIKGKLVATSDGREVASMRINSRPVRRLLVPIPDVPSLRPGSTLELKIERRE